MISVVGGVYGEHCVSPKWDTAFGSGGRAAAFLSTLCKTSLSTALSPYLKKQFDQVLSAYDFTFNPIICDYDITFKYLNPLLLSEIAADNLDEKFDAIKIRDSNILVFGMKNLSFVVHGDRVVYDPQGEVHGDRKPFFSSTGSTAKELVYCLNEAELKSLTSIGDVIEAGKFVIEHESARAVVVKMGPLGAKIICAENIVYSIPAYRSRRVFKIGSGDVFSAAISYFWMVEGLDLQTAADVASRAVAAYVETKDLSIGGREELERHYNNKIEGIPAAIYLASPFFSFEQLWLLENTRNLFLGSGLQVFSPLHDVGFGGLDVASKDLSGLDRCKSVFGIINGNDPGTMFELGYAKARQKLITVYAERSQASDLTMLEGTGCKVFADYTSAIYNAIWDSYD